MDTTKMQHKAVWEKGYADRGVACSCGFIPKRPGVLKNHVEKKDPAGFALWRKELWGFAGIRQEGL